MVHISSDNPGLGLGVSGFPGIRPSILQIVLLDFPPRQVGISLTLREALDYMDKASAFIKHHREHTQTKPNTQ